MALALNATLPPTVAEFRKAFPEFVDVPDDKIEFELFSAMQWVDTYWSPIDAKLAVMYSAAHFISLHDDATGGASSGDGSGSGGGGGTVDPEVGKIYVKTVRFRDRMVTYERVDASAQKDTSAGTGSDASEFWEGTYYGKRYLSFLRRNVPHIAVI
jgi:hypothetical protein